MHRERARSAECRAALAADDDALSALWPLAPAAAVVTNRQSPALLDKRYIYNRNAMKCMNNHKSKKICRYQAFNFEIDARTDSIKLNLLVMRQSIVVQEANR
jgi:hypothetical protein